MCRHSDMWFDLESSAHRLKSDGFRVRHRFTIRDFVFLNHSQPQHKAHVEVEMVLTLPRRVKAPPFILNWSLWLLPPTLLYVSWHHHDVIRPGKWKLLTKWQSGREKPESAGKGSRVEKEGSRGWLMEKIQTDPAAQHDPGAVFHTGRSKNVLFQMRNTFVSPEDNSY